MRTLLLCLLAMLAATSAHATGASPPAAPAATPGDGVVNTFEADATQALRASNATATRSTGVDAAEGEAYLRLAPAGPEANLAQLRLALPPKTSPAGRAAFAAAVRAPGATEKVELRWFALDAKGRPLFQRRFDLEPGERWVRLDEPLRGWRWDNARIGDWDEVASVALVVASPDVARVDIDDVRFTGTADEQRNVEWLLGIAFPGRAREVAQSDGLLVATDAVDAFAAQDLDALLDGMRRTRAWVRTTFGDAVRPTDDLHAPAALLIFRTPADYAAFFDRLGAAWHAKINVGTSQGFTIQDIAASTFDPKLGTDRPVYFHEAVHAVVVRDLRLRTGHAPHRPLQEALANYLQVCRYPQSLPPGSYAKAFARPIDPSGQGFFKPLEMLFTRPVTTREYAQLASVAAYLAAENPKLLRELARGLADDQTASDLLARTGTTWRELEDAWLAWGRKRFTDAGAADDPTPFELPPAFR
jgi:hypothetical protein